MEPCDVDLVTEARNEWHEANHGETEFTIWIATRDALSELTAAAVKEVTRNRIFNRLSPRWTEDSFGVGPDVWNEVTAAMGLE